MNNQTDAEGREMNLVFTMANTINTKIVIAAWGVSCILN